MASAISVGLPWDSTIPTIVGRLERHRDWRYWTLLFLSLSSLVARPLAFHSTVENWPMLPGNGAGMERRRGGGTLVAGAACGDGDGVGAGDWTWLELELEIRNGGVGLGWAAGVGAGGTLCIDESFGVW